MSVKHEWRKKEKVLYIPKAKPEIIDVPQLNYITISGEGGPASQQFTECIAALYPVAYAIKMQPKKQEIKPTGYNDFTVYPLEGIWDITEHAKQNFTGTINKEDLVYKLMIRQPDFVDEDFFHSMLELTKQSQAAKKRATTLLDQIKFESISEGKCIQMLHIGSYDDEENSFSQMEAFAEIKGLSRLSKVHREVYLSDFRKTATEKLKTTLRFQVIPFSTN